MQKFFDIVLLKFIDDGAYRTVITIIILFSIIFSINVDRKLTAEIGSLKRQNILLDNMRLQMLANESKSHYDVLIDTYALFANLNKQYRTLFLEYADMPEKDKKILQQKIESIDEIISKQLGILLTNKVTTQEYYKMLRINRDNLLESQQIINDMDIKHGPATNNTKQ